ncbi:MAG: AMP-binding protein [Hymenobacter sp.]
MAGPEYLPTGSALPGLRQLRKPAGRRERDYEWPTFDENTASSLCYTSGTTDEPKGVLYSHRSTLLHSYAASLPDCFNCSAARRDFARRAHVSRQCLGRALPGARSTAASWCCPAPPSTRPASTNCLRAKALPSRRACPPSGSGC